MTKHNPRIRLAAALSAAMVATSWLYPTLAGAAPAPVVDSGTGGENGRVIGRVTGGGFSAPINVRSFRWGATLAVSATTGGAVGKPIFADLTFGKVIDATTPGLMTSVAAGPHFPTLTLEVFSPGSTNVLVRYELADVMIVGVTTGDRGRPNGGGQPIEEVSVSYTKIQTTVGTVTSCYDIVRATRC